MGAGTAPLVVVGDTVRMYGTMASLSSTSPAVSALMSPRQAFAMATPLALTSPRHVFALAAPLLTARFYSIASFSNSSSSVINFSVLRANANDGSRPFEAFIWSNCSALASSSVVTPLGVGTGIRLS